MFLYLAKEIASGVNPFLDTITPLLKPASSTISATFIIMSLLMFLSQYLHSTIVLHECNPSEWLVKTSIWCETVDFPITLQSFSIAFYFYSACLTKSFINVFSNFFVFFPFHRYRFYRNT